MRPLCTSRAALSGGAQAAAGGAGCEGQCGGCKKKKCKFDDRCFYDPAANFCQDVGPNVCRGIQKRHGGKASVEAGGPGGKKGRSTAGEGAGWGCKFCRLFVPSFCCKPMI